VNATTIVMDAILIVVLTTAAFIAVTWFFWRWLIRQAEAAQVADWGGKWLNRLDGLNRLFCRKFHRLRADMIPLPRHGAAIVVANHLSGLDPLLMAAVSPRPLRFMIAREEFERWWLRWLFKTVGCISVGRETNSHVALGAAQRALSKGEVVALFPHGRIHLDHEPPIRLKRGVFYLAQSTGAPIFPLRIEGIKGVRRTVAAVFMRSQARIKSFPPLYHEGKDVDTLLNELSRFLAGK